jgi:Tfp pilus assembly protein PilO
MTTTLYLLTLLLPLATILIVFGMRYSATIQQARARLASDEAYRTLAETAAMAQARTATSLAALETTLSDVRERMTGVEKVLKAVE